MKNYSITLSIKEVQHAVVAAFVEGLCLALNHPDFFITYSYDDDSFFIELWKSATFPEKGDAKRLLNEEISRHSSAMNDIRIKTLAMHFRESSYEFISECFSVIDNEINKSK